MAGGQQHETLLPCAPASSSAKITYIRQLMQVTISQDRRQNQHSGIMPLGEHCVFSCALSASASCTILRGALTHPILRKQHVARHLLLFSPTSPPYVAVQRSAAQQLLHLADPSPQAQVGVVHAGIQCTQLFVIFLQVLLDLVVHVYQAHQRLVNLL